MQASFFRPTLTALALTALIAGAAPAAAEMVNLKADLKGGNEVPPVTTNASGSFTAQYDTASKKLTWKGNYSGLSGNATAAHFHGPADKDKNAGVVVPFKEFGSSFEGSAELTEAQANDLLGGRWYVNIHTQANPGGELRGQVTK
jgi:hypothetical protein